MKHTLLLLILVFGCILYLSSCSDDDEADSRASGAARDCPGNCEVTQSSQGNLSATD